MAASIDSRKLSPFPLSDIQSIVPAHPANVRYWVLITLMRTSGDQMSCFVADAKALLRVRGHIRYAQQSTHERDPRHLGDWLKLGEVPKLSFAHLNFSYLMVKHPISKGA
jgi:hypothetical protein